ncbi:MAG: PIN domain nuclease [Alkalinema sp. CAN_BIN05]|nr:PIN domain nuclease [Alkalinema sp. CAN_BIN05]
MVIVDSSVWIDYFNGRDTAQTNKLDDLLSSEAVGLGDLILVEVLQGFREDKDYQIAKQLLTALTVFNLLGSDIAVKSANHFRSLRKRGVTVRKTADVVIATFCIENNYPLLFSDKDFIPFMNFLGLIAA